jgi:uncharacterized DUF497 family protein
LCAIRANAREPQAELSGYMQIGKFERGDRVRIISARVATSHERRLYEQDT